MHPNMADTSTMDVFIPALIICPLGARGTTAHTLCIVPVLGLALAEFFDYYPVFGSS
jgi:hypothetical protein